MSTSLISEIEIEIEIESLIWCISAVPTKVGNKHKTDSATVRNFDCFHDVAAWICCNEASLSGFVLEHWG